MGGQGGACELYLTWYRQHRTYTGIAVRMLLLLPACPGVVSDLHNAMRM